MKKPILLTDCTILETPREPLTEHRYIIIDDGSIRAIGPMEKLPDRSEYHEISAEGKLAMPGLVNAHNHCAMTLFRGLADDLELADWLHNHIFPAEAANVSQEMVYWCTKLAAAEMLLSGTTCVADGYFFSGRAAQALHDAGMRAVVAHGIVDFPAPSVPDPSKNIETVDAFLHEWSGVSDRIQPAVFAHAPYTCSPTTLSRAKRLADRRGVRFFIHVAESRFEQESIIDPQAETPIQHLAKLGLLDENCVCVHSIWLDDRDLETVARSGAHVVCCPQSNLKLASGIARVQQMLERGIAVGLGTDGCASNNSLDMFREMDVLAKIQKSARADAEALPAREVLNCATEAGAGVLGLNGCGRLKPGCRADIILLDLQQSHLTPFYNQDLLVYAAAGSDVDTVIIDGRLVMHKRQLLSFDLSEVYEHVACYAEKLR